MQTMEKPVTTTTAEKISRSSIEKFLTFRLDSQSYGIAVLKVREIIRLQTITLVPQMPEYVKGVINLRGKVIPVIDLRLRFELPSQAQTESTCIIVVQVRLGSSQERLVGLVVDAVEEVLNISAADVEESPNFGSNLSVEYISGMAKVKGDVKTLLDIDTVMSESNLDAIAV